MVNNREIVELGVRHFGLPLQFDPASLGLTEAETLFGNDGAELPDSLAVQGLDPRFASPPSSGKHYGGHAAHTRKKCRTDPDARWLRWLRNN